MHVAVKHISGKHGKSSVKAIYHIAQLVMQTFSCFLYINLV